MLIRNGVVGALLALLVFGSVGCGYNQDVKNVWKGTKGWWYRNVSVPASIDYDEKGEMSEYKTTLAQSMIGIDVQLTSLEKIMNNADKPPTNEWVQALFTRFPWLSGFTGVKADGSILGQVPGLPMKPLDFLPLLNEDNKQNLRALRGNVQNTPMGPEVFLATPLYDAHTFLGIVSVYFDMRELLQYSDSPDELVIVSPQAVLWAGKYNFASTPMAGVPWDITTLKATSGTVTNAGGSFYWTLRYLGNQPLIFGVAVSGSFDESYNSRTGPVDASGFVEPTYVEPEVEDDESVEDVEESTTEGTDAEPTEASTTQDGSFMPSPIHPDSADDTSDSDASTTDDSEVNETPEAVEETAPRAAPAPVSRPSPIYPDAPDSDADSTSVDASTEDDSEDASTSDTEASSADDADASDATSVESDTADEEDDDQGSGYRQPSPFGPQ